MLFYDLFTVTILPICLFFVNFSYSSIINQFFGFLEGIVGAQVPVGIGLAFAHKYRKEPNCSITIYGDGASN